MNHEPIPAESGYDVAALETRDGGHVGYVSIPPMHPPPGVISTGHGSRFFVCQEGPDDTSQPIRYVEAFHFACMGTIRGEVSE